MQTESDEDSLFKCEGGHTTNITDPWCCVEKVEIADGVCDLYQDLILECYAV
jgi:hypothetical protein